MPRERSADGGISIGSLDVMDNDQHLYHRNSGNNMSTRNVTADDWPIDESIRAPFKDFCIRRIAMSLQRREAGSELFHEQRLASSQRAFIVDKISGDLSEISTQRRRIFEKHHIITSCLGLVQRHVCHVPPHIASSNINGRSCRHKGHSRRVKIVYLRSTKLLWIARSNL